MIRATLFPRRIKRTAGVIPVSRAIWQISQHCHSLKILPSRRFWMNRLNGCRGFDALEQKLHVYMDYLRMMDESITLTTNLGACETSPIVFYKGFDVLFLIAPID